MNKAVLSSHQPSLTEWFEIIGNQNQSQTLRQEDNTKNQRLEILYQQIGLTYERPEHFEAIDLLEPNQEFKKILAERGNKLCAIRLVPKQAGLPKLRQRGLPLTETYERWFCQQQINFSDYRVEICPHSEVSLWAATFVVNDNGIFGEIVRGRHNQLTQGESLNLHVQFYFNFTSWQWNGGDKETQEKLQKMVQLIRVTDKNVQKTLQLELSVHFIRDYLVGYFETTVWADGTIYFIDFNRILPKLITQPPLEFFTSQSAYILKGATAFPGVVQGRVKIVDIENFDQNSFQEGDVLVCDNTDVRYVSLMKRAGAIVTNRGGILSHAAIVARELKKPCIIGMGRVTDVLKDGDMVQVDAERGIVVSL